MKKIPYPTSSLWTIYSLGRYKHGLIFSVKWRRNDGPTETNIGTFQWTIIYMYYLYILYKHAYICCIAFTYFSINSDFDELHVYNYFGCGFTAIFVKFGNSYWLHVVIVMPLYLNEPVDMYIHVCNHLH